MFDAHASVRNCSYSMPNGFVAPTLPATIGARPVDAPSIARHGRPEQTFRGSSACAVVEGAGSFVEPPRVPGIWEAELSEIQMMAEFVAERAQKSAERRDFLPHRRAHPYPNQHFIGAVVSEPFAGPAFPNPQRPGRQDADATFRDSIEFRHFGEGLITTLSHRRCVSVQHGEFNGMCDLNEAPILLQIEGR